MLLFKVHVPSLLPNAFRRKDLESKAAIKVPKEKPLYDVGSRKVSTARTAPTSLHSEPF